MDSSIPVQRQPANAMLHGLNSGNLAHASQSPHPLTRIAAPGHLDLDMVRRQYGLAMSLTLQTERSLLSPTNTIPGLQTGNANPLLETLMGTDESLHFEDFMNKEETRTEAPKIILHDAMEVKLNL
ncbi:hypothetical protein TL16_g00397 [Triparma laevis f. inornata]|uniref:Proteasome maturation protein n=2 Tax=Triparma laevis TaxID=1534972 RepID=A0A9W7FIC7_9STRA|nr:hypothetical protein TL16_g00397 [Triparma laevis f. inornata]GMI12640.1 hypothetical protein TrLO_g13024 [Triparma laevis f. longispina]